MMLLCKEVLRNNQNLPTLTCRKLCAAVVDENVKVREVACRLLSEFTNVKTKFLMQTFSKGKLLPDQQKF